MNTIGVYILIKDFDILYIGSSFYVENRVSSHSIRDYDYYVIIPCPKGRAKLESDLIYEYKPLLNKLHKDKPRVGVSYIKD